MKPGKPPAWPLITLAIVFLSFGILYICLKLSGYTLVPMNRTSPAILSTAITAVMVALTILGLRATQATRRINGIQPARLARFAAFVLPVCAIVFVVSKAVGYDVDEIELYLLPVYACLALVCGMVLFFAYTEKKKLRVGLGTVYTLVLIPLFVWLLSWDFGPQPVIKSEMSPGSLYIAELVKSDRKLYGQSASVYAAPQGCDIEIRFGTLKKDRRRICKTDFSAAEMLTLVWESDEVLLINGNRFIISRD